MKVRSFILALIVASAALAERAWAEYGTSLTRIRYANAYCESGGDPHAVSPRGTYRGKWQFDLPTWRAFAPQRWRYVDPAWAPEWVQDRAALNVTYDAWPHC